MEINLDERWGIGGKLHGGYLLREIAAPLVDETHPYPMAVSAHFVRSPTAGAAVLESETLRSGRRLSQHRARLLQGGESCVEALVTTGVMDASAEPYWTDHKMPTLPPVEDCLPMPAEPAPGFRVGHLDFVELRADPATVGFAVGQPTNQGRIASWARMPDHETRPVDLLVIADALPPVTFELGVPGWVPTIELTVLVRGVPAPGWLVAVQRARVLQDGFLDEECDIWDSRGRLVCQARQLAGYRLSG